LAGLRIAFVASSVARSVVARSVARLVPAVTSVHAIPELWGGCVRPQFKDGGISARRFAHIEV